MSGPWIPVSGLWRALEREGLKREGLSWGLQESPLNGIDLESFKIDGQRRLYMRLDDLPRVLERVRAEAVVEALR